MTEFDTAPSNPEFQEAMRSYDAKVAQDRTRRLVGEANTMLFSSVAEMIPVTEDGGENA